MNAVAEQFPFRTPEKYSPLNIHVDILQMKFVHHELWGKKTVNQAPKANFNMLHIFNIVTEH